MGIKNQTSINLVEDTNSASTLLNPIRIKILECLQQPNSASGLARHLNLPRQKLNYHLRELEKKGLIELIEEKRKGNCVERIVRASARSYLINPEALGNLATDPDQIQDQFSSTYLLAVAARTIRDLAILRSRAENAKKRLATFTLQSEVRFGSASELNAFTEELSNTIAKLVAKYHDEKSKGGRLFKFIISAYPTITKHEKSNHSKKEEK